jgi:hypothetical protein
MPVVTCFIWFFIQKFYESYDKAWHNTRKTAMVGLLQISSNFTSFFEDTQIMGDASSNLVIQVSLDNTFVLQSEMSKKEIYDAYDRFSNRIMVDCEHLLTIETTPIVIEPLYRQINFLMVKEFGLGLLAL